MVRRCHDSPWSRRCGYNGRVELTKRPRGVVFRKTTSRASTTHIRGIAYLRFHECESWHPLISNLTGTRQGHAPQALITASKSFTFTAQSWLTSAEQYGGQGTGQFPHPLITASKSPTSTCPLG